MPRVVDRMSSNKMVHLLGRVFTFRCFISSSFSFVHLRYARDSTMELPASSSARHFGKTFSRECSAQNLERALQSFSEIVGFTWQCLGAFVVVEILPYSSCDSVDYPILGVFNPQDESFIKPSSQIFTPSRNFRLAQKQKKLECHIKHSNHLTLNGAALV